MKKILFVMMCLVLFGCGNDDSQPSIPHVKQTFKESPLPSQGSAGNGTEDADLNWRQREIKRRGLTSGMTMREHFEAAKNRKDKVVKF